LTDLAVSTAVNKIQYLPAYNWIVPVAQFNYFGSKVGYLIVESQLQAWSAVSVSLVYEKNK